MRNLSQGSTVDAACAEKAERSKDPPKEAADPKEPGMETVGFRNLLLALRAELSPASKSESESRAARSSSMGNELIPLEGMFGGRG